MIILDTNVVSALMQHKVEPAVHAWLDQQPAASVWITSITQYEIEAGLMCAPPGRRRNTVEEAFQAFIVAVLQNRVLDFDSPAARAAAAITAQRRRSGRIISIQDTQIAGIATARRGTIATRNLRDFADLEVPVVNPWIQGKAGAAS